VSFFKLVRVVLLLCVFFIILISTWMNERRLASWERPVWLTIYPIVADEEQQTLDYVEKLDVESFADINTFFERSLKEYGVSLTPPFEFQIAPVSFDLPPIPPDRHSTFSIALWSLKMRWWSWRMDARDDLISPDIQVFVLYHSLNGTSELNMSVGMRKGMYGLVKAYATRHMQARNQMVIAHELLHVFGATDKYAFSTGDPEYPNGYAQPYKKPLFPQFEAEIMGGRIPLNSFESVEPASLAQCVIGDMTAKEIGLLPLDEEG